MQEVVSVAPNPVRLGQESPIFSGKTVHLLNTGAQLVAIHDYLQVHDEIILILKNISIVTPNLLVIAKSVSTNSDAPGAKHQLNSAAR